MAGKRANGEGSIIYDKRRKKPYRAKITIGWELDEETGKSKQVQKDLGSYKTKGEAAAALANYLKNPFDIDNKDITFSQFYELWYKRFIEDHKSSEYRIKSAYKYCSSLYNKKFREISITDMKDCINKGNIIETRGKYKGQKKFASPSTKESMKYLFNHMCAFGVESRLIERNYAKEFTLDKKVFEEKEKKHKDKIPFDENQIKKLWKSIEFVPFADMILYNCYSGWRPTELVEIKVENVNLEEDFIVGGIKTKAGKQRIVPIHPLVKDIILKYYNEAVSLGSEYLFNDPNNKKGLNGLSYDQYLSRFNKVMDILKFSKEITPHYARHTFISIAKSQNVNMNEYILKLIVGHKINDITENVYTHRSLEDLKREMLKIKS